MMHIWMHMHALTDAFTLPDSRQSQASVAQDMLDSKLVRPAGRPCATAVPASHGDCWSLREGVTLSCLDEMFDRQRSSRPQMPRKVTSKAREELEADAAQKEVCFANQSC